MPVFMLNHRHRPEECRVAYAAWKGFDSPLRRDAAFASCASRDGGSAEHHIWWHVEASDAKAALALLPPYVAERTEVDQVEEIPIP